MFKEIGGKALGYKLVEREHRVLLPYNEEFEEDWTYDWNRDGETGVIAGVKRRNDDDLDFLIVMDRQGLGIHLHELDGEFVVAYASEVIFIDAAKTCFMEDKRHDIQSR